MMRTNQGSWRNGRKLVVARQALSASAKRHYLLALKAAIATSLAWVVAHFVPGPAGEYPYYAPLGALVSMYPTVFASAKHSLQTLLGLALGIALGLGIFIFGSPNAITIGVAAGIGVLLGGLKSLGPGSTWVATAALFVVVIGGNDAEDYSLGYLVQMLVGVVVGIAVNLVIFPPLNRGNAEREMLEMKSALADQLADISAVLHEDWPPERDEWAQRARGLSDREDAVRDAVQQAHESRRANPRKLLHPQDINAKFRELFLLEQVNFAVRELTEVLSGVVWSKASLREIPQQLVEPLATTIGNVSDLLREWGDAEQEVSLSMRESFAVAEESLSALNMQTDAARVIDHEHEVEPRSAGRTSVVASITVTLSRILDILRPVIDAETEPEADADS